MVYVLIVSQSVLVGGFAVNGCGVVAAERVSKVMSD